MRAKEFISEDTEHQSLNEMAFSRKRVIRALESFERTIPEHAVKVIVLPQSQDVRKWKNELRAWSRYLATMRLKGSGAPIGQKLAYQYLYADAFDGSEIAVTKSLIRLIEASHEIDLSSVDPRAVHETLKDFLTKLSHAIGDGKDTDVETVIKSL